eukprot:superscaffoldBa00003836_g17803
MKDDTFVSKLHPWQHCLTVDIRQLKQDLKNKDELILGFSSIATTQAQHLPTVGSSCCGGECTSPSTECSASVAHALDGGDGLHCPVRLQLGGHLSSARASTSDPIGGSSATADCTSPAATWVQSPRWSGVHAQAPLEPVGGSSAATDCASPAAAQVQPLRWSGMHSRVRLVVDTSMVWHVAQVTDTDTYADQKT